MFANKFKIILITVCYLGSLPCNSAPIQKHGALTKKFQVEIIAFKINNSLSHTETFPLYPALPEYNESIELSDFDEQIESYMLLPREYLKLNKEENLIDKKSNYQVLFHYGWLQNENSSKKIHLSNSNQQQSQYKLSGTIQVKKGYYFTVDLNLDLQPPKIASTPNTPKHFILNTKRKLKRNELHYIDHPKFGLLIQITPQ